MDFDRMGNFAKFSSPNGYLGKGLHFPLLMLQLGFSMLSIIPEILVKTRCIYISLVRAFHHLWTNGNALGVQGTYTSVSGQKGSASSGRNTTSSTASSSTAPTRSGKPVDSLAAELHNLNLKDEKAVVAAKKAPADRAGKRKVTLMTNVFPMVVENGKDIYHYEVLMKLVTTNKQTVELHFRGNYSPDISKRAILCNYLLEKALEDYRILNNGQFIIHDGSATIYCSENMNDALGTHQYSLRIPYTRLPDKYRQLIHVGTEYFQLDVKPCLDGFLLNTADYVQAQSNRDMGSLDRTFKQFFDLLTNYDAIRNGKLIIIGACKMFQKNFKKEDLKCGHERARGLQKGIKFIEGSSRGGCHGVVPSLVLDAKVGDFFLSQSLKQTVSQFMKHLNVPSNPFPFAKTTTTVVGIDVERMNPTWMSVDKYIRGIRMKRIEEGNTRCSFIAIGISRVPISEITEEGLTPQKPRLPLMSRFAGVRQNIDQRYPAVMFKGYDPVTRKPSITYSPMEMLTVAEGQSVRLDKMIAEVNRPDNPSARFRDIERNLVALNLHRGGMYNELLKAFGVSISVEPVSVNAIERQKPTVSYKNNRGASTDVTPDAEMGNWRMPLNDQYAIPANISEMYIIGEEKIIQELKRLLSQHCPKRGIRVGKFTTIAFSQRNQDTFKKLSGLFDPDPKLWKPKQLIIFIDPEEDKSHNDLKLFERSRLIGTMHITRSIAIDMLSKSATRDNVIHKINEKVGGVNHLVHPDVHGQRLWNRECSMIIGYDVQHDTNKPSRDELLNKKPPSKPSVVGFSFNGGMDKSAFIGDFHYQNPLQEKVDAAILKAKMAWMLKLFINARRQLPQNIIIVRDGVSEGQFAMAMNEELPAFRKAVAEYNHGESAWHPKFVLIIVTKRHNMRFFAAHNNGITNPKPGTVIDDVVVRNDLTEFYMQAHRVIIGTGKIPSFQILIDETNSSSDELQSIMHALCTCHKIVDSPVSKPEPVYMADEWAKRGGNLFNAYDERYNVPRIADYDKDMYSEEPINFDELSAKLCYANSRLEGYRVNA